MNLENWLNKWHMSNLKINIKFLEMDLNWSDSDRNAAWELYIELLTRITTQELANDEGDEQTALESIYKIFGLTREIIKKYNRDCMEFSKIAIVVLNQKIRPFTAKWHKVSINGFSKEDKIKFRMELKELQDELKIYTKMLGDMAGVEDFNDLTMLEE